MTRSIKYVAVDFDGTCCKHEYPEIGGKIGAGPVLREMRDNGIKIILNTMRCEKELDDAVEWFEGEGIELFGVNENPTQKSWTTSPKVHADVFIDDRNVCGPLKDDYVDWVKVLDYFVDNEWIVLSDAEYRKLVKEIENERK